MTVLSTQRLDLRLLDAGDAPFMLELLNDPSFIANIGDRGVRTLQGASAYIQDRIIPSYARHGHGLYRVQLRATGAPIGICGLVRRDYLDDPDVGFAFLPRYRRHGYARESAAATMAFALDVLGARRVLAIAVPHNADSIRVLQKIGLRFERMITPPGDTGEICLYTSDP